MAKWSQTSDTATNRAETKVVGMYKAWCEFHPTQQAIVYEQHRSTSCRVRYIALSHLGASAVRQREESTSHAAKEEEEIGNMPGMQKAQVLEATLVQLVLPVHGAPQLPTRSVL